jgi:hypothetical protein
MANYFLTDLYLQGLASEPSAAFPQNYFRLQDHSSLVPVLPDFATCLYSNIVPTEEVSWDGWEKANAPDEFGHEWSAVTYGNGLYVAVAERIDTNEGIGMIATSPDGIDWTIRTTPGDDDFEAYTVDWIETLGLFIVGGYISSNAFNILTSPDGITWTARQTGLQADGGGPNKAVHSLTWSEPLGRLLVSNYWGTLFHYSDDGSNWTAITAEQSPGNFWAYFGLSAIAYSDTAGVFCAAGHQMSLSLTSTDGINWIEHDPTNIRFFKGFKMAWSPTANLFAFFGEQDDIIGPIYTSPDGINWTSRPPVFTTETNDGDVDAFLPIYGSRYNSVLDKFEMVTSGDENFSGFFTTPPGYILESTDGITWDFTPGIPGMHNYGYAVLSTSEFRDTANKSVTEKVLVGHLGIFYSTIT